jgi:hypothetical protein
VTKVESVRLRWLTLPVCVGFVNGIGESSRERCAGRRVATRRRVDREAREEREEEMGFGESFGGGVISLGR